MSVTIPTTEGFPLSSGTYEGDTCYDRTNNCFYVWNNNSWYTLGTQGPPGKDVEESILKAFESRLNNNAGEIDRIRESSNILEQMTDLFMFDIITRKRFAELRKMMKSGDEDSINTAKKLIDSQYQKHIG